MRPGDHEWRVGRTKGVEIKWLTAIHGIKPVAPVIERPKRKSAPSHLGNACSPWERRNIVGYWVVVVSSLTVVPRGTSIANATHLIDVLPVAGARSLECLRLAPLTSKAGDPSRTRMLACTVSFLYFPSHNPQFFTAPAACLRD